MSQELLTAQKLAKKLGLSVETIWRYSREKRIPVTMIGTRQYRYDFKQVLQSLHSKNTKEEVVQETKSDYSVGAYTYTDYAALPVESGYTLQLIEGSFVREPAPILQHQRVSRRLQRILEDYFFHTNPLGELFNSPVDLFFTEHSTVQPDLVFVNDATKLKDHRYIDVIPELIVEILSPSSRRTDTIKKLNLYLKHNILHYWIVEPEKGLIEVLKLENGKYAIITVEDEDFAHPDFPNLSFNMRELVKKP